MGAAPVLARTLPAALALVGGAAGAAAQVTAENFTLAITLTSDYVWRGISQTGGEGALQASVEFAHGSGFFAGVWASTIDIAATVPGAAPRDLEVDTYAGYRLYGPSDFAADVVIVHYTYPGAASAAHYDYTEAAGALHYGERVSLALTATDDAFGFGIEGWSADLTARWPLPRRLRLAAGLGTYHLDSDYLRRYEYWNLGLSRSWRHFTADLSLIGTDSSAHAAFGGRADDRLVLSLSAGR